MAKWDDDDIEKVFQGEIGLVFDKDTIHIHRCDDKIIKNSINEEHFH